MEEFCARPTRVKYGHLDKTVQDLLYKYAKQIMQSGKRGDYRLANRIMSYHDSTPLRMSVVVPTWWRQRVLYEGWVCDDIPAGSCVFRASKTESQLLPTQPTYFAMEAGNANQYLPSKKKGCLGIFHTKALRLFRLDDVHNINRLLNRLYKEEEVLYRVVLKMFYPPLLEHYKGLYDSTIHRQTHPIQFKRLIRYSLISNDFVFSNWLCKQGFDGYSAGVMDTYIGAGRVGAQFPEEVLLCKPSQSLHLCKVLHTQRKNTREALDALLDDVKTELCGQFL